MPSPTPVPTLSAQQVCAQFSIIATPAENAELDYDATAQLGWRGVPDGASVTLSIVQHDQQEGLRIDVPVTGDSLLAVSLARLYGVGQFDWKLRLHHPQYGDICEHSGTFFRKPLPFM